MRPSGSLDTVPGASAADHVCWVHGGDDDAAFDDAVRTFLAGGLDRGERLLCVGERVIDSVRKEAAPFIDVDKLVADGTLGLMTLAEAHAATGSFSAENQFAFYDGATRRAVAEGYAGLRVVAELTPLAADPLRREELLRWEHLADRYMVEGPGMSALCAYRDDLPVEALTDVASVHPAASPRRACRSSASSSTTTASSSPAASICRRPTGWAAGSPTSLLSRPSSWICPGSTSSTWPDAGRSPAGPVGCAPAACRWRSSGPPGCSAGCGGSWPSTRSRP